MSEPAWLEKARGYLDLGMHEEAWRSIASLPENFRNSAEAQEMRIVILFERGEPAKALAFCRDLIRSHPDNHAGFIQGAYALHAMKKTGEAVDLLQSGPETLREDHCYFYNLACYEVALGRPDAALTWLQQSFRLEPRNRARALNDADLTPLHESLSEKPE